MENVVVKPQDGKYYRYPSYIKDVTKTPKITPEMLKYIDDFASTLEFHPSYNGKFVNDSKINNPNEKYHAIYLYALGPKHNNKVKFKNSKGKEVYQHQVYTINMQSEAATDKLTSVLCSIFEQNPDIPDGKTTYVVIELHFEMMLWSLLRMKCLASQAADEKQYMWQCGE